MGNIRIHFIRCSDAVVILKMNASHVPRTDDEIRLGGEGSEKYYRVIRVVWAYDEPECPFDRVNIGVDEVIDDTKNND